MGTFYHWDADDQKFKEGPPPCKLKIYGQAPYVISDTTDWYRHPATGVHTNSKSRIRDMDKATGCITTDKKLPPNPSRRIENERRRRKDATESLHRAVAMVDAGTAKLTEEVRAKCDQQNDIVSKALNFDAYNAVGRKNNPKGKQFRRK